MTGMVRVIPVHMTVPRQRWRHDTAVMTQRHDTLVMTLGDYNPVMTLAHDTAVMTLGNVRCCRSSGL